MIVVVDTNIFLNVLRDEKEFVKASEELLRKMQKREITGLTSSVALMEIKWVLSEKKEFSMADRAVSLVEEIAEIIPVDKEVAKEAIDLKIRKKIELLDSIHAITAYLNNAVLVTRDEDLRKKVEDTITVQKPEDILKEC